MKEKNTYVWERLSKHLDENRKEFVLEVFEECFDYSPFHSWDKVIADLVTIMYHRKRFYDKHVKVAQVKSKFGGLRFYIEGDTDDYLRGAIKMAEIQCSKICAHCGSYDREKAKTGRYVVKCILCDGESFEMT